MLHNQKIWSYGRTTQTEGEILLESNAMSTSIIAFSYLSNLLARKHKAKIVAYLNGRNTVKTKLANRKINKIYRSFNVSDFIYYDLSPFQSEKVASLYQKMISRLKTKRDVESLTIGGVWFGDLLYDSHCLNYEVPTISLEDPRFHESLRTALQALVFWRDYLDTHRVRSVIVSHTVYIQSGIITRLAIQRAIPVYHINATHVHYLTKKNLWAYDEFFYYPEYFRELPEEERKKGLATAKERLDKRLSGRVGVDMHYSTQSAYGQIKDNKVLKESPRKKILVATHCFFDNPHPYGVNLFPDFYEWLYFLGEISELTDYDWYIKTHPDFLPGNIPILEEFTRRYPKFMLLPSDTSHLQLKEEGINFGLTVYGTIGVEYPALGIPVVTASQCNPRIRYKFNIHPKTIEEYRHILMNLQEQKLDVDMNEIYEFYFMHYLYGTKNWLFCDYDQFICDIGGYYRQCGSISYEKFLHQFSEERHAKIVEVLNWFVESKEYLLRPRNEILSGTLV